MFATIKRWISAESALFLSMPALLWHVLFFVIPTGMLILMSIVSYHPESGLTLSFSYYYALFNGLYAKIIIRSLGLALIVSCLCFLVGYPIAYYIGIQKRDYKTFFISFLILPFWTNILIHIYAWFFVLEKNGFLNNLLLALGIIKEPLSLLNNLFAVILVMFYCYLPFMVLPIISNLEKFDMQLIEASYDLGASGRQTFFKIIFPLSLPGIKTGFFLVFVPAFAEFVIPLLLGGDKFMYVGTLIAQFFLVTQEQSMGTAFTVFSSIILVAVALIINSVFHIKYKTKGS